MFRRLIAGSFIALWLVLLGLDFSGDAGLIQDYRGSETDRAVDSVLTTYEQATHVNDTPVLMSPMLAAELADFPPSPEYWVESDCTNSERLFFRDEIPIYKLHLAFLI